MTLSDEAIQALETCISAVPNGHSAEVFGALISEVKELREKLHEAVELAGRPWNDHDLDNEVEDYGTWRIAEAHNRLLAQVESLTKERDEAIQKAEDRYDCHGDPSVCGACNACLHRRAEELEQKLSAFRKDADAAFERINTKLLEIRSFVRPTLDFHSLNEVKIIDAIREQFREERYKLREGR